MAESGGILVRTGRTDFILGMPVPIGFGREPDAGLSPGVQANRLSVQAAPSMTIAFARQNRGVI